MNDENSAEQMDSSKAPKGMKEQSDNKAASEPDEVKKLQESFGRVYNGPNKLRHEYDLKFEAKQLGMEVEEYQRWYELRPKPRSWFYWIFHRRVAIWIFQLIRDIWHGIGLGNIWSWCFGGKKLWDFLQLLIVPIVLGLGAWYLQYTAKQREQDLADDRNRQESLNKYFDTMTDLLLKGFMRTPGSEAQNIARARTLTTLGGLDGNRKGQLLRFLNEARLINNDRVIVHLSDADLRKANLSRSNLSQASFQEANLVGANLYRADLQRSNLQKANLQKANLLFTNFSHANLQMADLSDANLLFANLPFANLSKASLKGAFLFWARLQKADLSYAYLEKANLEKANLSDANLLGAFLRNANLQKANLTGANLSKADLQGANLTGANLSQKQLDQAKLCRTIRPNGEVSTQDCEKFIKEEQESENLVNKAKEDVDKAMKAMGDFPKEMEEDRFYLDTIDTN